LAVAQVNTSGIAANESVAHPLLKTLRIYGTAVIAVVVALVPRPHDQVRLLEAFPN